MADRILHYINDPLCGWCYAAEPLVQAAAAAGLPIVLHGGGLWEPATHASLTMRQGMRDTDARIARLMGQPFGVAYLDGTLLDPATSWWSRPTTAAVLAGETMDAGLGLAMMAAVQRAHYLEGRRVVATDVLIALAAALGLDAASFADLLEAVPVDVHIRETRALMAHHGLHGFPSFLLEHGATVVPVPHVRYYGDPSGFVTSLIPLARAGGRWPMHQLGKSGGRRPEAAAPDLSLRLD